MKVSLPGRSAKLALRKETLFRQTGGDPTDDKDDLVKTPAPKGPVPSNYCLDGRRA